jgi:hypothetical protein
MGRKSHTWAPLSPDMGSRNQVGIGLSYRPASLCSLAAEFQTRFLESIPRPVARLNFPTLLYAIFDTLSFLTNVLKSVIGDDIRRSFGRSMHSIRSTIYSSFDIQQSFIFSIYLYALLKMPFHTVLIHRISVQLH